MKIKYLLFLILLSSLKTTGFGQEPAKKSKEEIKLEMQKQNEELLVSKNFAFVGRIAYPQSGRSVNITADGYTVTFHPDIISGAMPFFGRSYGGSTAYGGSGGLEFEGKPEEFNVVKTKKGYSINAVVKTSDDTYKLSLTASSDGSGSLSILTNNRSPMSYSGTIVKPEEKK